MADHDPDQTDPKPTPDPFYVGYRPAPEPHRRAVRLMILLIALWAGALVGVRAMTQQDPGRAAWDISNEMTWSGVFVDQPYPMLISEDPDSPRTLLVVSMGKRGAHDRLIGAHGHRVVLRGYELRREGRYLIELSSDEDAVRIDSPVDPGTLPHISPISEQQIKLTGEIVDGKCYLGAMKPGDGYTHRSCATLCIRGGLPPMFVAQTDVGNIVYPLLLVDGSTQLDEDTIAKVACKVRIRGQVGTIAGLPVLRVATDGIQLAE